MKKIVIILFFIFWKMLISADSSLLLGNEVQFDNLSYEELVGVAESDTTNFLKIKKVIINKFPTSEVTWEYSTEEFYDRLYPIWRDSKKQILMLDSLLIKYHSTSFKRTIYLYQIYNLKKNGVLGSLSMMLDSYRKDFPKDYQSFWLSARFEDEDSIILEKYIRTALELAKSDWKPDYYPTEQWLLEHKSASQKCTQVLADILFKRSAFEEALSAINLELSAKQLGVNDEDTYIGLYFKKAQNLHALGLEEKAIDACINALIEGDSRNRWVSETDSLLSVLLEDEGFSKSDILNFARERVNYTGPIFQNVTYKIGLDSINAGRVSWGDYNSDGFDDLLLGGSRLFQNENGNGFIELTNKIFVDTLRGNGAIWADINNDGALDVITKDPETVWLWQNSKYEKVIGANAILDNGISTEGMAVADIDGDGFLDIYLANYENWKTRSYNHDEVWRGNGDGTFVSITKESGLLPEDNIGRAGRGVNGCDFDLDGDIDIFVSNYRLQENYLYVNDGLGNFSNQAVQFGVAGTEVNGWWGHTIGSEWGDYDADGDFDLITANLAHPRYIDFSNKTRLYQNQKGKFIDQREFAGIKFSETHSEPCWADFDNDGYLDLLITCVYQNHPSVLYHNNGDGTFTDISWLAGVRHLNGWGAAASDYNNDGKIDLLIAGGETELFQNITENSNNWITFQIKGNKHADAIGTQILYNGSKKKLIKEIQGGKGTSNQQSLFQHFGLADAEPPYRFKIRDDSGKWKRLMIKQKNGIISYP